jgi:hypothetical protein
MGSTPDESVSDTISLDYTHLAVTYAIRSDTTGPAVRPR